MSSKMLNKIIILLIIVIAIITIILFMPKRENVNVTLELLGSEKIVLHQYETYNEFGYKINNKIDGYYVKVNSTVNTSVMGTYNVVYNLYNKNNELVSSLTRKVYVIEDTLETTTLVLKGDAKEYFFQGDYVDHGIEAYRGVEDVSNMVVTSNNVNPNKVGSYIVEYYITNGSYKKNITREVNIVDYKINKVIDKEKHTIKLIIDVDGFDYVILPNEKTYKNKELTYNYVVSNLKEEYVFDIYIKGGSHKKYSVLKNELGADKISGTCSLKYANKSTIVTIKMDDLSLVSKFRIGSEDFKGTTKIISGYKSKVTINAYNYANQVTAITCTGTPPTATPKPTAKPSSTQKLDKGIKKITGHTSGNIMCNYDVSYDNIALDNAIKKYGYRTRGAVMAAGIFLANYKFNIPYKWAGKYFERGLDPSWGCNGWGLDCTGFTKWAFIQAGFDPNIIPRSGQDRNSWGTVNPLKYTVPFSASTRSIADSIKPGDIVTTPYVHAGLVIGVNNDYVQVVQESTGINVIVLRKIDGRLPDGSASGFTHFTLLDEFYKVYGK